MIRKERGNNIEKGKVSEEGLKDVGKFKYLEVKIKVDGGMENR